MLVFFLFSYKLDLDSIYQVILEDMNYEKCRDDFLHNLIFPPLYLSNEITSGKSKKNQHPFFSLLESSIFVLVEKTGETAVSELKVVQVSKH